ncbi:ETC complex I subunit [Acidisoma silvae]|uniref:ETC complex I subunit n=1 Tax=Acidisoma silvae TaxID=2802396 RepID=A0A964DXE0_9PROT|nr:ETC complex I subunit [Acidisoma silvae]MCB8873603.1 ETC complex I subunit [Acidisoma silvae]
MRARIFRRPKSAMQSGFGAQHHWVLEWQRQEPQRPDPLMGWIGGGETQQQVVLSFPTREEAIAYAERNGAAYDVEIVQARAVKPKAYADNFRNDRVDNWSH